MPRDYPYAVFDTSTPNPKRPASVHTSRSAALAAAERGDHLAPFEWGRGHLDQARVADLRQIYPQGGARPGAGRPGYVAQRFTVRLSEDEAEQLDTYREREGLSRNDAVRQLVREHAE